MPTLDFTVERLSKLVGKELNLKDLQTDLQWISLDIDDFEEKEQKIKVEFSPNRPDFASPEGIARALKGYYELEMGLQEWDLTNGKVIVNVDEKVKKVRPYIVAAIIRNVDLDDDEVKTAMNIQEALHHTLGRDRKKVAIGLHDFDKVKAPFKYTTVKPEEMKFRPLQMEKLELTPQEILEEHPKGIIYAHILKDAEEYPMIFDANNEVVSFPPIINGILTTVTETTKNFLLDITGTDLDAIKYTLNILSTTFADMGATIETVQVIYEGEDPKIYPDFTPIKWTVNEKYLNSVVGLDLSEKEIIKCLQKCRLDAKPGKKKGTLDVLVPPYRTDFMHEVDFAEEMAMGYGYFNLPVSLFEGGVGKYHPIFELQDLVRSIMVGGGYLETMNFILTSKDYYEALKIPFDEKKHIMLENPVSSEWNTTRTIILPVMMKLLQFNRSEEKPINIFEVGDVVQFDKTSMTGAKQELHVCALTHHSEAEFTEIRSIFDHLIRTLGIWDRITVKRCVNPTYIEGRVGDILLDGKKVGNIGELYPEVLENFGLKYPVAVFEMNLTPLLSENENRIE
ncbi:MAG: phenylalanine--tRNA ligase subunit beta [archaeon]|nr:phenylalanine--tRNA ligase subunit beta [archaeon]